jgi:hypothetical protein
MIMQMFTIFVAVLNMSLSLVAQQNENEFSANLPTPTHSNDLRGGEYCPFLFSLRKCRTPNVRVVRRHFNKVGYSGYSVYMNSIIYRVW